jgi:hypothetical protein
MESFDSLAAPILVLNRVAGKPAIKDMTPEQLTHYITVQNKIVLSECKELMAAIEARDALEFLDGICDVVYTGLYLERLHIAAHTSANELLDNLCTTATTWCFENAELFVKAMNLVIENNASKYTTDLNRATSWVLEADHNLVDTVIEGVNYYSIVDRNGKMRKPSDFVPVDLSDLAKEVDTSDNRFFL